ncbi:transcription initiation factor TFIID subunit 4-like [Phacochoerus africanus]|uniref:transcription initiation factor TFIID subunit 4-like n=1 Tax=Phacochoerus africanus TaxID=41426 RepID=UPI001FD9D6D8|nr:transcription initiation factor TFIID subunit 4-like [Phacochoerus africanus]
MGRPRPLRILFTTNRLSRGISGSAKVHTGAAGGRGGRARRALPGQAPPGRPSRNAGALAAGVGVQQRRRPGVRPCLRPPSSSAPSTWGPGRPATWGDASPGRPRRGAPRRPWLLRAPAGPTAPTTCPLPGPTAPTSSRAPAPAACAFSRPAGSGAGRPQGALALPKSGSGRRCPRLARGAAIAVGARRGSPVCWNLQRLRSLQEAKTFFTHQKKKNVPSCCLDLAGAIFKASPWVGAPGLAGRRRSAAAAAPENQGPGLARRPNAPRLVSEHQDPGRAPAAPRRNCTPVTRGVGAQFAERSQRLRAGRALLPAPQSPPNSSHVSEIGRASSKSPSWAELSP